jgi:transcriptional regulator GlxA family with amidase domain
MATFSRSIVFLLVPPFELLDLAGPVEVFDTTNKAVKQEKKPYSLRLVSSLRSSQTASTAGLSIAPTCYFEDFHEPIDTLLIVGGTGVLKRQNSKLLNWLKVRAAETRRIGSICTGAFLLAQTGLLDGKKAVTHWNFCNLLASQFRQVKVEADPIFLKDGNTYTTAGVSAGIDLSLALVEEDLGTEVSTLVARLLVLFLRRSGGQKQFSSALAAQEKAVTKELRDLPAWVMSRIGQKLDVNSMAEACAMSPRNFARRFALQYEKTPALWLQGLRVDMACTELRQGKPLKSVARDCGFQSVTSMRRAFLTHLKVTPSEYQERFHGLAPISPFARAGGGRKEPI